MDRKEAIKIVRGLYEKSLFLKKDKEAIETLIPEIKDDEDERIRKEMIEYFSQYKEDGLRGVDITPWIAYLERQKEQELDENITDEEIKQAMGDVLNFKIAVTDMAKTFNIKIGHNRDIDWHNFCASLLTYLKRHAGWSEKDERMLEQVVDTIGDSILECDCDDTGTKARFALEEERKWLKSLPERFK